MDFVVCDFVLLLQKLHSILYIYIPVSCYLVFARLAKFQILEQYLGYNIESPTLQEFIILCSHEILIRVFDLLGSHLNVFKTDTCTMQM